MYIHPSPHPAHASSYLAWWMAIALQQHTVSTHSICSPFTDVVVTHLPLGSVWFDQVGVQRMTVEAHDGGKCSSNMVRYQ